MSVDVLVSEGDDTIACMKKLDRTAHKVLFVTDDSGHLMGALTDGDIRRWILAGRSLEVPVGQVCHRRPITVKPETDLTVVRDLMIRNGISAIPVVNTEERVLSVVFWTDLMRDATNVSPRAHRPIHMPVVVMAGGAGSRLKPFTTILPKPLIPVGDQSIVEHIIDQFRQHGVSQFVLTLGHKARMIRAYFEDVPRDYELQFFDETTPLGTAGALRLMAEQLPETFLVTNCDVLIRAEYADLLDFHRQGGHAMTLVSSMRHYRIPYGICEIDPGGRLVAIREKPEYHFLVSAGLYVVEQRALTRIPKGCPFHMTDLIADLKAHGDSVGVYPISERAWEDTGEWPEYQKTISRLHQVPPRREDDERE